MMEEQPAKIEKPIRSFGRRKARKLRSHKQQLVQSVLPDYVLPSAITNVLDLTALFPHCTYYRLEIGFGDGEHLAAQATQHPEIGFIGAEPFLNGVAALVERLDAQRLPNVRIWHEDVRPLLRALPEARFTRIDMLFPDPWPKTRHHKRRLLQAPFLESCARILRAGGEFRFVSDDADYIAHALETVLSNPTLEWTAERPADWKTPPDDWCATKYQRKAAAEGRAPTFLLFRKIG